MVNCLVTFLLSVFCDFLTYMITPQLLHSRWFVLDLFCYYSMLFHTLNFFICMFISSTMGQCSVFWGVFFAPVYKDEPCGLPSTADYSPGLWINTVCPADWTGRVYWMTTLVNRGTIRQLLRRLIRRVWLDASEDADAGFPLALPHHHAGSILSLLMRSFDKRASRGARRLPRPVRFTNSTSSRVWVECKR